MRSWTCRCSTVARSHGDLRGDRLVVAQVFYDVLFNGKKFEFQRPYGSYVMENVLFKVSYPGMYCLLP